MNLVKWNPWRDLETFEDRINRLFGSSLFPTVSLADKSGLGDWRPVVDVYEEENSIVIKADLPGVDKKDIAVDLKDGVLTLKGERSHENEVKKDSYHRKERAYGKFQRCFTLSGDVDPDKIKAEFKDGVLKIDIPKPEEQKPKKISVH